MELHGTLGPSRTSMSAVAAHAGVRRSTLYRHFPDEAALFDACTAALGGRQPAARSRRLVVDRRLPTSACGVALGEIYAFYRRTEAMLDNLLRDETSAARRRSASPPSAATSRRRATRSWQGASCEEPPRRRTQAAIGHAIAFSTLEVARARAGAPDDEAAALMRTLVAAAG